MSIYEVDTTLLADLHPTHIITQTQCKVCAVSLDDVCLALTGQTNAPAEIISLEPYVFSDLWSGIRHIASACEEIEASENLIAGLQRRMNRIEEHASHAETVPRVAVIEWLDPFDGVWQLGSRAHRNSRRRKSIRDSRSTLILDDE